jgi:hypothetical protein
MLSVQVIEENKVQAAFASLFEANTSRFHHELSKLTSIIKSMIMLMPF